MRPIENNGDQEKCFWRSGRLPGDQHATPVRVSVSEGYFWSQLIANAEEGSTATRNSVGQDYSGNDSGVQKRVGMVVSQLKHSMLVTEPLLLPRLMDLTMSAWRETHHLIQKAARNWQHGRCQERPNKSRSIRERWGYYQGCRQPTWYSKSLGAWSKKCSWCKKTKLIQFMPCGVCHILLDTIIEFWPKI